MKMNKNNDGDDFREDLFEMGPPEEKSADEDLRFEVDEALFSEVQDGIVGQIEDIIAPPEASADEAVEIKNEDHEMIDDDDFQKLLDMLQSDEDANSEIAFFIHDKNRLTLEQQKKFLEHVRIFLDIDSTDKAREILGDKFFDIQASLTELKQIKQSDDEVFDSEMKDRFFSLRSQSSDLLRNMVECFDLDEDRWHDYFLEQLSKRPLDEAFGYQDDLSLQGLHKNFPGTEVNQALYERVLYHPELYYNNVPVFFSVAEYFLDEFGENPEIVDPFWEHVAGSDYWPKMEKGLYDSFGDDEKNSYDIENEEAQEIKLIKFIHHGWNNILAPRMPEKWKEFNRRNKNKDE